MSISKAFLILINVDLNCEEQELMLFAAFSICLKAEYLVVVIHLSTLHDLLQKNDEN